MSPWPPLQASINTSPLLLFQALSPSSYFTFSISAKPTPLPWIHAAAPPRLSIASSLVYSIYTTLSLNFKLLIDILITH